MADRLDPDQTLAADQEITSNDGKASLIMQGDGNLVLYEATSGGTRALWASDTWGNPGSSAVMQGDGNLVVYAPDGNPLWASDTWGNPGAFLVMQDDRNAVVYAPDWIPLWASNTYLQTQKVGFDPKQHGFHFGNSFVNRVATIPGFGNIETR